jgi:hypothetical protein
LCFWLSSQPTIELIKPRLEIDSAERTKLEIRIGQNSDEAKLLLELPKPILKLPGIVFEVEGRKMIKQKPYV